MNVKSDSYHNHSLEFEAGSTRLNHILDQFGFKSGWGRVTDFHSFLMEADPDNFSALKYTTVRAWFQGHIPPMKKIDAIFEALQQKFEIHGDHSKIKAWWKLGGHYPFSTEDKASLSDSEDDEKLKFVIMSLVMEEANDVFGSLSGKELQQLLDTALKFTRDYENPLQTKCPHEYIKMIIRAGLSQWPKQRN